MTDDDIDTARALRRTDDDPTKWAHNLWAKMRPGFGDRPVVLRLYRITNDRTEEMKV